MCVQIILLPVFKLHRPHNAGTPPFPTAPVTRNPRRLFIRDGSGTSTGTPLPEHFLPFVRFEWTARAHCFYACPVNSKTHAPPWRVCTGPTKPHDGACFCHLTTGRHLVHNERRARNLSATIYFRSALSFSLSVKMPRERFRFQANVPSYRVTEANR